MAKCQCLKSNGQPCHREASIKITQNPKFCWQHQNCQKINPSNGNNKSFDYLIIPIKITPDMSLPGTEDTKAISESNINVEIKKAAIQSIDAFIAKSNELSYAEAKFYDIKASNALIKQYLILLYNALANTNNREQMDDYGIVAWNDLQNYILGFKSNGYQFSKITDTAMYDIDITKLINELFAIKFNK